MINLVRLVAVGIQLAANWVALTVLMFGVVYEFGHTWLDWPAVPEKEAWLISAATMLGLIVLGIISPIGPWWFNISIGARNPSGREAAILDEIGMELSESWGSGDHKGKMPRIRWQMLDSNDFNAMAYGNNQIAVSRGLLQYAVDNGSKGMEALKGVCAHELGHICNGDTRIYFPLMFSSWPLTILRFGLVMLMSIPVLGLFFGAIFAASVIIESISWGLLSVVSKPSEFRADRFACQMTGGEGLLDFFEVIKPLDVRSGSSIIQHYMQSHPPTEMRRNRIERFMEEAA